MKRLLNRAILELATWGLTVGFFFRALWMRGRGTHTYGVGASGRFRVVDDPEFPAHPFFTPGREFPLQIRHATAFREDDACKNFRSIALKLSDDSLDSPLDLIMNTGVVAGFWHTWNFYKGVWGALWGERGRRRYQQKNPPALQNVRLGTRRAPESFTKMYYYTNVVFEFHPTDEPLHLVKFRVAPDDLGPESGVAAGEDGDRPWVQDRLPEETRPKDYLRREYLERLAQGDVVRYRLQMRLHRPQPDDTDEVFNIAKEWDPETHPWIDVGTLEVDRALPEETTERLRFRIYHQPESLGVIPAESIFDYRSIGHMRTRVYPRLQWARFLFSRLTGQVGPGGFPRVAPPEATRENPTPIPEEQN